MSNCKQCGHELIVGEAYCTNCGTLAPSGSERKEPTKKRKRKMKKGLLIGLITGAALLLLAAVVVLFVVIIPNSQYKKALELGSQYEYEEAVRAFEKLGDYKDSQMYRQKYEKEYNYEQAVVLFEDEDFENASIAFADLGSFKEAEEFLFECEDEIKYSEASQLFQQEMYGQALMLFEELGAFRDSKENVRVCKKGVRYQNAVAAYDMQNYVLAKSIFEQLGDFKDSSEQAGMLEPMLILYEYAQEMANGTRILPDKIEELKALYENEQTKSIGEPLYYKSLYLEALWGLRKGYTDSALESLGKLPEDYEQTGELLDITYAYEEGDFEKFVSLGEAYSELEYHDLSLTSLWLLSMRNNYGTDKEASLNNCVEAYGASRQLISVIGMSFEDPPADVFKEGILYRGELENLVSMCGQSADGKVLLVYEEDEDRYNICTYLMDRLPAELVPQSLDEVEYIVVAEFWDSVTDIYDSGTIGIRHFARVRVVRCPSGKTVKTIGTIKGTKPPSSFTYSGGAPLEKHGTDVSKEEVRELFVSAVEKYIEVKSYEDFDYVLTDDWITIIKYKGNSKTPVMPDAIDGVLVKSITKTAFKGHEDMTSITLSSGLTGIPCGLFRGFTELEEITLPGSVVRIGSGAFSGCTSLSSVCLTEGLRSIESSAFYGCTDLTNIMIPGSVIYLGSSAFKDCTSLNEIILSDHTKKIYKECFSGCVSLKHINLTDKIQSIREGAFRGSGLVSITLPDSVEYIGEEAFAQTQISEFDFPPNLKYIGENAFMECRNLKELRFPETVLWIDPDTMFDEWITLYVKEFSCAYSVLTDSESENFEVNKITVEGITE